MTQPSPLKPLITLPPPIKGGIDKATEPEKKRDNPYAAGKPSNRLKPVLSNTEFSSQHTALQNRIDPYEYAGGTNKITISRSLREAMKPSSAHLLAANNMTARIRYAQEADRVLRPFLLAETRPVYWLTMVRAEDAVPYAPGQRVYDAKHYDPRVIQGWVYQQLAGISFVGVVDIGCYPVAGPSSPLVASFHAHMFCWGVDEARMVELCDTLNQRYKAYVPFGKVAKYCRVSPDQAAQRVWYMAKFPLKWSRFVPHREKTDGDTGEVRQYGQDRHYEALIKTGLAVRMCEVLDDKYLDQLAFAGGEGRDLIDQINHAALAQNRARQRGLRKRE